MQAQFFNRYNVELVFVCVLQASLTKKKSA